MMSFRKLPVPRKIRKSEPRGPERKARKKTTERAHRS
jgi:hypothetical protein